MQNQITIWEYQPRNHHLSFNFFGNRQTQWSKLHVHEHKTLLLQCTLEVAEATKRFATGITSQIYIYRINGTDLWVVTSCTDQVGGNTTPYNVSRTTMIHGVTS
jgi:hypothetical protein